MYDRTARVWYVSLYTAVRRSSDTSIARPSAANTARCGRCCILRALFERLYPGVVHYIYNIVRSTMVRMPPTIRVFTIYQIMLGWEYVNIMMKPSNSPTQGQPYPRKVRLKLAFGYCFPTGNSVSWVRIGFI